MLIRPIITYGSEIWISDFTQKDLKSDNLPFEKIHNRYCKYLLGVHKKASNFASRCELGRFPILNFITCLTFKYYQRLIKLPSNRLVKEAYEVDRGLFNDGQKSWYSFIYNTSKKMKVNISNMSEKVTSKIVNDYYDNYIKEQLTIFKKPETDSKLTTFANCYKEFKIQKYLDLNLPKNLVRHLSKLRISAHTLMIEKGRYCRPKIQRNLRLCSVCNQLENEEHFLLFCKKYTDLRAKLFLDLNLDYSSLNDIEKATSIFVHLMNPENKAEVKYICEFIQSAFLLCVN